MKKKVLIIEQNILIDCLYLGHTIMRLVILVNCCHHDFIAIFVFNLIFPVVY